MPPPPPPSASYLLDIDTDDSDDDEEEENEQEVQSTTAAAVSQQQQDDNTATSIASTPSPKKKKKRRRKRNKKKKKKGVHFGDVSVREYERCLGSDVVPLDGGWPLGISTTVEKEYQVASTVDEFEERRQAELRDRWLNIMSSHTDDTANESETQDKNTSKGSLLLPPLTPPTGDLETRQYDYRKRPHDITKSTKNPLFGPLDEETRMMLLVSNDSSNNDDDSSIHSDSTTNNNTGKGIPKSPTRSPSNKRRTRSNSMHNNDSHHNRRSSRRTRSNSEQYYSEQYPSTDVLHVRNELEQIRVHRTLEGSLGCTCRKLNVYLPPPDGGGKKAQHRRLKPQKVKEELRKRGKLPNNANDCSRAELEQLLHDIVQEEPCCWGEDCSCRKDGIGCQADACSCWFESHQRKGNHDAEDYPSVKSIRERCGNNMYAVDLDGINAFRMQFCQVINGRDGAGNAEYEVS